MLTTRQAEDLWGRDHLRLLVGRGIYKRVLRGVYAEADDDDPWLVHRAALLVAPPGSGLCGPSSAALLTTMVDIPVVPHIFTPRQLTRADLVIHRDRVEEGHLTERLGMVTTDADLTAAHCARWLPRVDAVVTVDRLLRQGGATKASIAQLLDEGGRGVALARQHLADADPGTDSPPETRLRLLLVDGGLPRPATQCRVSDDEGRFVAALDLGWAEAEAGLDYMGDVHLTRRQAAHDRSRRRAVRELTDWDVQEVGAPEMSNPRRIVWDAEDVLRRRCPRLLAG